MTPDSSLPAPPSKGVSSIDFLWILEIVLGSLVAGPSSRFALDRTSALRPELREIPASVQNRTACTTSPPGARPPAQAAFRFVVKVACLITSSVVSLRLRRGRRRLNRGIASYCRLRHIVFSSHFAATSSLCVKDKGQMSSLCHEDFFIDGLPASRRSELCLYRRAEPRETQVPPPMQAAPVRSSGELSVIARPLSDLRYLTSNFRRREGKN